MATDLSLGITTESSLLSEALDSPSPASSSPVSTPAGSDQPPTLTAAGKPQSLESTSKPRMPTPVGSSDEFQAPTPAVRSRDSRPRVPTPVGSSDELQAPTPPVRSSARIPTPVGRSNELQVPPTPAGRVRPKAPTPPRRSTPSGSSNRPPVLTPAERSLSSDQASTSTGKSTPSVSGRPRAPTPGGSSLSIDGLEHIRGLTRTPTQQSSSPSYISIDNPVKNRDLRTPRTHGQKSSRKPTRKSANLLLHEYTSDSSTLLDAESPPRHSYGAAAITRETSVSQDWLEEVPQNNEVAVPQPYEQVVFQPPNEDLEQRKGFNLNMEWYIMSTLGAPNMPKSETHTKCSWIAVPFYLLLFLWGAAIMTLSIFMIVTTHRDCRDMLLPYSLTLVVGAFFVLLFLYWLLVFVKKISPSNSLITIPWFFLAMLFAAAISALAIEIYEQRDMIIYTQLPEKSDPGCNTTEVRLLGSQLQVSQCTRTMCCNDVLWDYKDILRLPLFALGSMGILCAVYVCVFLACACRRKIGHLNDIDTGYTYMTISPGPLS